MLIHLGDAEGSEDRIETWCREQNENCQVHMILGNNDFFQSGEGKGDFHWRLQGFLTHGHFYSVSVGTERLADEARDRKVQIAMFGHTHKPCLDIRSDLTILNPGSLSFPRQDGRKPSYMIMELDGEGKAHYTVNYL